MQICRVPSLQPPSSFFHCLMQLTGLDGLYPPTAGDADPNPTAGELTLPYPLA